AAPRAARERQPADALADAGSGSVGGMGTAEEVQRQPDTEVVGLDVDAVSAWMAAHVAGSVPPFSFTLVAGGRSNLTFRVEDAAGRAYALRRPPVSHVLPTAHDMTREHRVMTALGPTDVPVPVTYGLCVDETVNGRPFYVMEFVAGHILKEAPIAEAVLDGPTRRAAAMDLADALAALHAVDVDQVGLGDLGRREDYIGRQVRRWTRQYEEMAVDGPDPLVAEVGGILAASVPEQQRVSIVHGDYRLDNVVVDDHGKVVAILDWEICTLGDPLADLGLLLVYWAEPEDGDQALVGVTPTVLPGFARRSDLLALYSAASGRDVSQISYYRAFGFWKLACILQGVHVRYAGGAAAGDRSGVEQFAAHVGRLGERALAEVESL
ncbi:MAG TPA: phosphotransferase family protein, partial [Acidimicrobiales bacterium]|nr:phosphotransferase family protein [Acidimicrobiales bacterium]